MSGNRFLTAHWKHLAMLNYEVDPTLLQPYVPAGTELDLFKGKCYVSMVGFMFLHTRVLGLSVPFHRHFEEVNLRFYVKRKVGRKLRRGVVFIKELVPKRAIALAARYLYGENYQALRMGHSVDLNRQDLALGGRVEYYWQYKGQKNHLSVLTDGEAKIPAKTSLESFITEHYYGYSRQRDGSTLEYEVEHPQWQVYKVQEASFFANVANLYGDAFVSPLSGEPASAFLARGSDVIVYRGVPLG